MWGRHPVKGLIPSSRALDLTVTGGDGPTESSGPCRHPGLYAGEDLIKNR